MSKHDPKNETPESVPQGGRPRRAFTYMAVAIAGVGLIGRSPVPRLAKD